MGCLQKIQAKNIGLFFAFVIYVQLYPNIFFDFGVLKYAVKYPFIVLFFCYLFYYYVRNGKFVFFIEPVLMGVLVVVYAFYDIKDVPDYGYMALMAVLLSVLFINKAGARDVFVRAYIYVAVVLSVHAFVVYLFQSTGSLFFLYYNIPGVGGDSAVYSPLFGLVNTLNIGGGYRASSFFTEANRFAYFLVPVMSAIIYSSIGWKKGVFIIFLGSFALAQSVAAMMTIFFVNILYARSVKYKILMASFLGIIVFLVAVSTISGEGDYNRGISLAVRLSSFEHLYTTLFEYPYGITARDNWLVENLSTNISFIYWAVIGGWIGLVVFLLFTFLFAVRIHQVIKVTDGYERGLSIGIMAYLILQVFLGIGIEFLFSAFIALIYSYYYKYYNKIRSIGMRSVKCCGKQVVV